jgi:hypothetical protein
MLDVRFTPENDRTGMSPRMTRRAMSRYRAFGLQKIKEAAN